MIPFLSLLGRQAVDRILVRLLETPSILVNLHPYNRVPNQMSQEQSELVSLIPLNRYRLQRGFASIQTLQVRSLGFTGCLMETYHSV